MCTPEYIQFGPSRYKFMDFLTFLFFNTLPDEAQRRFMNEFEVNEHGQYMSPSQQQFQDSGLSFRVE